MSFADEDPFQEKSLDSAAAESPAGSRPRPPAGPPSDTHHWLIRRLRGTIALLDDMIAALETCPSPRSPISSWLQAIAIPVQILWRQILLQIRRRLPAGVQQTLSDSVLTGMILALVVLGIWLVSSVFSGRPSVATATAPPTVVECPVECPPCESQPTAVATTPPESPPAIAPAKPELAPTPEAKPAPTPKPALPLELTPEQSLIAAIQSDIAEISVQYADGLVQAVQANFPQGRLVVTIGDEWYNLTSSRQEQLGRQLLAQARALDFVHLELRDRAGTLIARSPVVGDALVILQPVRLPSRPSTP
ncbi:hypothetical protein [Trichothermofontia sp.]